MDSIKFVKYVSPRGDILAAQLDENLVKGLRDLLRLGVTVFEDDYLVIGIDGRLRVAQGNTFEETYSPAEENLTEEQRRQRRTWLVEFKVEGDDNIKHQRHIAGKVYNTEDGVRKWFLENGAKDVISVAPAYGKI